MVLRCGLSALGIAAEILFEARKKIAAESPAEGNAKMIYELRIKIYELRFTNYTTNNMQKLTNKEEEIMHVLWKLEKAFVKEVMAEMSDDPHYNTLSTIIRNLEEKGFVSHHAFGNTHQYYPIVSKADYRKKFMNTAIDTYFNSSYKNMVSHFAKEEKISADELREILAMIESKK